MHLLIASHDQRFCKASAYNAPLDLECNCLNEETMNSDLKLSYLKEGFSLSQVPEDHGEADDSSEKTPSKASKSPQKTNKRPKTVPVKVTLLDGSDYEAAVEVCC